MKKHPLLAYLVLVALISGGFIAGMKMMGRSGNYLAGAYMITPAISALITRLFFYAKGFSGARLGPGRWRDYLLFWAITLIIVLFSYVMYTVLGSITWDFSGNTFLAQLKEQMALSGKDIDDLPAGFTPRIMLILFFIGGLTVFNIPMIVAGFGEEFGWRGLMFPQLCRNHLVTGLIACGIIWFMWHVPLVFVIPGGRDLSFWQHIINGIVLAVGSICTFVFFAYVYARSGSIWVASLAHAVFNNGSRSFSYFAKVDNQILANLGLTITMLAVVAFLFFRKKFAVFKDFLAVEKGAG